MLRLIGYGLCLSGALLLIALPGCNSGTPDKQDKQAKKEGKDEHEHGETGPHGGPLAEWDNVYHAEFTADHGAKQAIVYIHDDKAKKAPQVEASRFTKVRLTITSVKPPIVIELTHDAKKSGPDGIAFVGTHDELAKTTGFKGNLSGLRDEKSKDEKRYSNDFEYEGVKDSKDKAVNLALKPGGIYTAADIKANGNTTPAEKYKGKKLGHGEDDPKPGDKICPISKSKANPDCVWIIQGQTYEFCCLPCVDQFIRLAHNNPAKVKDAKEYVYKGK